MTNKKGFITLAAEKNYCTNIFMIIMMIISNIKIIDDYDDEFADDNADTRTNLELDEGEVELV